MAALQAQKEPRRRAVEGTLRAEIAAVGAAGAGHIRPVLAAEAQGEGLRSLAAAVAGDPTG